MSYTLTTMTDEIEALLGDSGNTYVTAEGIEDAIRWAIRRYEGVDPRMALGTIADVANQVEYDIPAGFTGYKYIVHLWWPYDSTETPPALVEAAWGWMDANTFRLIDGDPDGTKDIRVQYAAEHTLSGLDSATATTLDSMAEQLIITGAAGRSLLTNVRAEIDAVNVGDDEVAEWRRWTDSRLKDFSEGLAAVRIAKAMTGGADARVSWG